jgi:hypothetical protein
LRLAARKLSELTFDRLLYACCTHRAVFFQ